MKRRVRRDKNIIFDLSLNKSKIFECQVSLLFLFLNDKKLSPHIDQISEHINYSNQKIYYHDQMIKVIVKLGIKKCKNNNNSTCQLNYIQNFLSMYF